jgi:hypothetical protein
MVSAGYGVSLKRGYKPGKEKPPLLHLLLDKSTAYLLLANFFSIALALIFNTSFLLIMAVYWIQSVIIGFFNFKRILSLRKFSTENFYINRKPATSTEETKHFVAFFFAIHYGFFHLVYGFIIFINYFGNSAAAINWLDFVFVLASGIAFFANHWFSFQHNVDRGRERQNIGTVMFFPYARIIPMHLTIVFAQTLFQAVLLPFLLLKTFADLIMHVIEHREFK